MMLMLVPCLVGLAMLGLSASGGAQQAPTPVGQLGGPVSLTPQNSQETPPAPTPTGEATPAGNPLGPEGCTVAPLPLDLAIARLNGTAESDGNAGSASMPSTGESTEAISTAFDIFIACVNGGDYLRIAAITTTDYFGEIIAGTGWDPGEIEAKLSSLHPRDPEEYLQVLTNGPVLMLSDSLATETVVLLEPASPLLGQLEVGVTFELVDGQWLVSGMQPVG
jgi:hypothetical protein